jgi:D-glycero-D-manno-heptose 1,7-bisphosphate phosphatase
MATADRQAIFLDRDGTLMYDPGYARDPQQVRLLPDVGEALAELGKQGFLLVLVSNQSGIGRQLITAEQAERVHSQLLSRLEEYNVPLHGVYYCPHAPEEQCRCRKPSPEMLLRAAEDLGLALTHSFMVGDKASDVEAGKRAGCRTILLTANLTSSALHSMPDYVSSNWSEALVFILGDIAATA